MGLGPRLDLRTSQTLVISPQLQAAIKLLTLSNLELQAEISAELDRNPLLEMADDGEGSSFEAPDSHTADAADTPEASDDVGGMDSELSAAGNASADDQDVDYAEERFHHDAVGDIARSGDGEEGFSYDMVAAEESSLAEYLVQQAQGLKGTDHAVALHLISLIDEAGYVTESLEEVAERLGLSFEEVERVLFIIQGFEPTGVGARNLAECIALQAKEADRYDPCMAALINNLELVARGELAQLRRLCDVDAEDLADMLRELRSYQPKPGLIYGSGRTAPVVPDIFVRRNPKGGWLVELNNGTLPRLIVNRQYQSKIADKVPAGAKGKADRQFVDQCASQANWLIRTLDQRANTIMKVATALVTQQEAFFEHGVQHLRPMTLRQIADMIEMHESTVSRVTSNKYLSCERGVFELKYFFTTALQGAGEDVSAERVRQRVKALIEAEPPLKPLSDDKLVELLKQEGFELARRTVTKYREAMNIPSSFERRRRAVVKAA